ncbi:hypothetical protein OIU74_007485 [Salix koriyanagi]|uniref:Uncharacterized protein n=1 Tax=Salix koriyanagi TaxID=2511006 RepID=A0A9Q0U3W6_9ROSI|nr:hypothetical protein OIU74_007485 [Salix koriyanagi]
MRTLTFNPGCRNSSTCRDISGKIITNNKYNHHQQNLNQQQQQQQQWLRRNQLAAADSSVDEVEKTVQSEAVDSRLAFIHMDTLL